MANSPKAPAADPIDARLVRRLADILTETGLSEIEVEHAGLKIRVAKQLNAAPAPVTYAAPPAAAAGIPAAAPAAAEAASAVRLLPDRVHERTVGAAAENVPQRRMRLLKAGGKPGEHRAMADLPV